MKRKFLILIAVASTLLISNVYADPRVRLANTSSTAIYVYYQLCDTSASANCIPKINEVDANNYSDIQLPLNNQVYVRAVLDQMGKQIGGPYAPGSCVWTDYPYNGTLVFQNFGGAVTCYATSGKALTMK